MLTILKPFLIRITGAWALSVLSHIARLAGIDYTPSEMSELSAQVAVFMVEWVIPISATVGGIVKVSLDKLFNKGNASSAPLIKEENALSDSLGAMEAAKKALR